MEQWITLSGSVATVRNRLTNARADTTQHAARTQELPAVYTWAKLTQLKTYAGTAPFTSGSLTTMPNAAPPWNTFRATEGWAAYVDANDWGLGVFAPGNVKFIGGFAGTPGTGSTTSANTGYIAPIRQEIIDHDIVYEHTYHLNLGSVASIRSYAAANRPDLKPDHQYRGTRSGWTYANATDAGFPVTDRLHVNLSTADPQMIGPECSFRAADVPRMYVRVAASIAGASQASGRLYWKRENGSAPMSTAQSKGFTITADGQFHTYEIDLSGTSTWTGQISRLRFDPATTGTVGDFVEVQSISAYAPSTVWVDVASGTQTQVQARASILTGTAGLTKTGTGTLSLTLSNTFTGPTRVNAGRLLLAHASALSSSTVSGSAGATLAVAAGLPRAIGWVDEGGGSLRFGYAAPGDTNVDGVIDLLDAANLLNSGRYDRGVAATWADGDFTYDGLVDVMDAAEFVMSGLYDAGGYGPAAVAGGATAAAVPEPGPWAALLAAAGCAATARFLRRVWPRRGRLLSF